jgi:hypothetical protein
MENQPISHKRIRIYTKVLTVVVFSLLCIAVETAVVTLLFVKPSTSLSEILPWCITVITIYFGVIKILTPTSKGEPTLLSSTPEGSPEREFV